ncbi:hypothetical protein Q8F55_001676 [Vanrija albida]|uniref:SPX domain-containing protein n=1 Tax=Vanrija albida TaxID=181172 RepID=A0ABR3Q7N9_9TREE
MTTPVIPTSPTRDLRSLRTVSSATLAERVPFLDALEHEELLALHEGRPLSYSNLPDVHSARMMSQLREVHRRTAPASRPVPRVDRTQQQLTQRLADMRSEIERLQATLKSIRTAHRMRSWYRLGRGGSILVALGSELAIFYDKVTELLRTIGGDGNPSHNPKVRALLGYKAEKCSRWKALRLDIKAHTTMVGEHTDVLAANFYVLNDEVTAYLASRARERRFSVDLTSRAQQQC